MQQLHSGLQQLCSLGFTGAGSSFLPSMSVKSSGFSQLQCLSITLSTVTQVSPGQVLLSFSTGAEFMNEVEKMGQVMGLVPA